MSSIPFEALAAGILAVAALVTLTLSGGLLAWLPSLLALLVCGSALGLPRS